MLSRWLQNPKTSSTQVRCSTAKVLINLVSASLKALLRAAQHVKFVFSGVNGAALRRDTRLCTRFIGLLLAAHLAAYACAVATAPQ
jgi:hypothetical protein